MRFLSMLRYGGALELKRMEILLAAELARRSYMLRVTAPSRLGG